MSINEQPEVFTLPHHSYLADWEAYVKLPEWMRENVPSSFYSLEEFDKIRMIVLGDLVDFTYKLSRPGVLFLGKVCFLCISLVVVGLFMSFILEAVLIS